MQQSINLILNPKYLKKYLNKYPLLEKESVRNWNLVKEEGTIVNLFDNKKKFIAKGYYGKQNKGYGWILSFLQNETIDELYFSSKIKKAIDYRKDFFADKNTTAFRLFNGEGDGVGGLTIDYFDGFYMITWYSLGIYKFRDLILKVLQSQVKYRGIYQKKRFDTKGKYIENSNDFICGEKAPTPLIVKENGLNFAIYLDDGAMVGVFLDQREVRKAIRDRYAKSKSVLNTFSYTGAFSVFASVGGATKTTSVDLAKRSLAKTQEQFAINSIDIEAQDIIVQDVFDYFRYAIRKEILFDMVVVDPPSFARSKKHSFSVAKDYVKLLKDIIKITNKGGIIVASTNYANFNMDKFKSFIDRAFRESHIQYNIKESFSLPKDFKVSAKFRAGNYLKVVFIEKC